MVLTLIFSVDLVSDIIMKGNASSAIKKSHVENNKSIGNKSNSTVKEEELKYEMRVRSKSIGSGQFLRKLKPMIIYDRYQYLWQILCLS